MLGNIDANELFIGGIRTKTWFNVEIKGKYRKCNTCKKWKLNTLAYFHKSSKGRDGLHSRCKVCVCKWRKENYVKQARNNNLKCMYGITIEYYELLYREQGGVCAICKSISPKLEVDHNHKTGKVRGLLCRLCNTFLGFIEKYDLNIEHYANYLNKYTKDKNYVNRNEEG